MGKEEALADLPIGEPLRGHVSDLQLLRRQTLVEVWRARPHRLPRRSELLAAAVTPQASAEGIEHLHTRAQRSSRFSAASLPAQPRAKREQRSRAQECE